MGPGFKGEVLRRGEGGYESARRAAVWNGRTPARFPDLIVQAGERGRRGPRRAARRAPRGCKVGVRSGGHSWAGNHVRDGGHAARRLPARRGSTVDAGAMTGDVGPGCRGNELLARARRATTSSSPAGHCPGVGARRLPAPGRLRLERPGPRAGLHERRGDRRRHRGGELVRADAERERRPACGLRAAPGPGFFGAVTRFHLRLYPSGRRTIANGVYLYPIEVLEEVFAWAHEIGPRVAARRWS